MKICFLCDLHLPFCKNALQYDVLKWAISDILKENPECIAFAGDVTCDGNEEVYDYFINSFKNIGIPFLYIPGNSDLRCAESEKSIYKKTCVCKNTIKNTVIFAVNDSDNSISDEQFFELHFADANSIVFMHHPLETHDNKTKEKLLKWRESHKDTIVFYGHLHISFKDENSVSLGAMDPDKSIGECPCITYYDTNTKEIKKSYYSCSVPKDFPQYFGISCFETIEQIKFAIKNGLKYLELRPNCLGVDIEILKNAVDRWRESSGIDLSIHLPDVVCKNGEILADGNLEDFVSLVDKLKANRVTLHVPMVALGEVNENHEVLEKICQHIAEKLNKLPHEIVVGVENMHMTNSEKADNTRRFGYTPEECIDFMETLSSLCKHKVGVNFDIGHARNNAPYSQKYQIGTWLSLLGKYIVGYHVHQVTNKNGIFENHMPIDDVYGSLISYASFFKNWSKGVINKAPVIFEMRPKNAYETTLKTFEKHKNF